MNKESRRTFNENILKREVYADTIINIVKEWEILTNDDGLVIALDSPWGTGKTTFIEKLKNKIKKDHDDIIIVKYNAWDNDYVENAFISLMYELYENEDFVGNFKNEIELNEDFKRALKAIGIAFAKDIFSKFSNTIEIIPKNVKNLRDKEAKQLTIFDDLKTQKEAIKNFKKILAESECLNKNNKKLFILIDELDRCKPLFAIHTLEIIKHLFNIKNVAFLLSVDFAQLRHSIATVYGKDMDCEGYLRRFVNSVLKLPEPNISDYVNFLFEETNFIQIIKNGSKNPIGFQKFKNYIIEIFEIMNLSLRDINIVFYNFKLYFLSRFTELENIDLSIIYIILMTIKYKYPNDYTQLIKGDYWNKKDRLPNALKIDQLNSIDRIFPGNDTIKNLLKNETMFSIMNKLDVKKIIEVNKSQLKFNGSKQEINKYTEILFPEIPGKIGLLFDDFWRLKQMGDEKGNIPNLTIIEYLSKQIEMFDLTAH